MSAPSLHFHYRNFITTTSWSAPVPCIGTLTGWTPHISFSLYIRTTGSHVPYQSLFWIHAIPMPTAISPVLRFTSKLIPEIRSVSGFDSVYTYRHLINGSFAFISSEHTWQIDSAFSLSLTTDTLNKGRIGLFDSSIWLPKPRGHPSSLVQQERLSPFVMTHERSGTQVPAVQRRPILFCYVFFSISLSHLSSTLASTSQSPLCQDSCRL